MRLFSALVPPVEVMDHLSGWLADHSNGWSADLHRTPADRWHVTLGFFGDDDDPDRRTTWLRERVEGRRSPWLRLHGGGTFPGVLWAGLDSRTTVDGVALALVANRAGADRRRFRPHLTLARWRSDAPAEKPLADVFAGYSGPWFAPDAVHLMRSDFSTGTDRERREPVYTIVASVPLWRD